MNTTILKPINLTILMGDTEQYLLAKDISELQVNDLDMVAGGFNGTGTK